MSNSELIKTERKSTCGGTCTHCGGCGKAMSNEVLEREIAALISSAHLSAIENSFFKKAKIAKAVEGPAALLIAHLWRETTKKFMFTTIAGIGELARIAAADPNPQEQSLAVMQTGVCVIADDLYNALPVFAVVAPKGVGGIHYVWWERSVMRPVAEALGRGASDPMPPLPTNVRALLDNMDRLATSPMGAAVQLRVVEAIALDICKAFKRIYSKLIVNGTKVFKTPEQLAWMNSHIEAEVSHNQQVSDHNTGMGGIADTRPKQHEMLQLTSEYVRNWNAALNDFAAALE